jgi:hypothetical protein
METHKNTAHRTDLLPNMIWRKLTMIKFHKVCVHIHI